MTQLPFRGWQLLLRYIHRALSMSATYLQLFCQAASRSELTPSLQELQWLPKPVLHCNQAVNHL